MKTGNGGETLLGIGLGSRPVAAGEVYEVQLRIRFAADTPPGDIALQTGGFEREPAADETIDSESPEYRTKVGSATGTGTGTGSDGTGGTGNTPKPDGGSNPTGGTTGSTGAGTGGELAETGADAATTWALGGGGTVLALGAALVAGTGRHRRKTA